METARPPCQTPHCAANGGDCGRDRECNSIHKLSLLCRSLKRAQTAAPKQKANDTLVEPRGNGSMETRNEKKQGGAMQRASRSMAEFLSHQILELAGNTVAGRTPSFDVVLHLRDLERHHPRPSPSKPSHASMTRQEYILYILSDGLHQN